MRAISRNAGVLFVTTFSGSYDLVIGTALAMSQWTDGSRTGANSPFPLARSGSAIQPTHRHTQGVLVRVWCTIG